MEKVFLIILLVQLVAANEQDPVIKATTIYNPKVPFTREIPGGMSPGKVIYLVGIPKSDFQVSLGLYCGPDCYTKCTPLSFYVHLFKYGGRYNYVIFNSVEKNRWGLEELKNNFPFKPNVTYEIKIICETWSFKISVNNQHWAEFFHRIQPEKATHIRVVGDTSLTEVRFEDQILENYNCTLGTWKCNDKIGCVWNDEFCDGLEHCNDGSDEEGCAEVNSIFEKFDTNNSGFLERGEVVDAIMDKITDALAEAEQATDSIFTKNDIDKDGKLNKIETVPSLS